MSMGSEPGGVSEIVGIVVAFIVLLITFGSLIAEVCQLLVRFLV